MAVLLTLAVLRVLVAAGQPFGRLVWGGAHEVLPTKLRFGSLVSIPLYAVFALVLLDRSGAVPVFGAGGFVDVACWVLFGYFALGILMNAISRSKVERNVMVPVAVVLAACALLVALS
ncbi:MAG: hypothetical protein ACOH1M_03255 [Rhodoglobus sp.]